MSLALNGLKKVIGYEKVILKRMNEEHGIIKIPSGHDIHVGDQLEIIPNHICSTVNLHNEIYLLGENQELKAVPVKARGHLQ